MEWIFGKNRDSTERNFDKTAIWQIVIQRIFIAPNLLLPVYNMEHTKNDTFMEKEMSKSFMKYG